MKRKQSQIVSALEIYNFFAAQYNIYYKQYWYYYDGSTSSTGYSEYNNANTVQYYATTSLLLVLPNRPTRFLMLPKFTLLYQIIKL